MHIEHAIDTILHFNPPVHLRFSNVFEEYPYYQSESNYDFYFDIFFSVELKVESEDYSMAWKSLLGLKDQSSELHQF